MLKPLKFIDHAEKRRGQRGFTSLEIQMIIERPQMIRKRADQRIEVMGIIKNRVVKVIEDKESYLKIISVM